MSIYLSAAHKSSGKTIVSLGLCAAFKQQSFSVQTFKKGPDYIDSIWLSQASGNPCYNLDFYNMSNAEITTLYQHQSQHSDITIIEGNKGLYDGISPKGGDANADLAKLLNVGVILVIDTSGITRGIAPLLNGYQAFDTKVNIIGVILNKVAGSRHQSKLIQAVEYYSDIPVLGAVRRSAELVIDERHLGLVPANEMAKSQIFIDTAAKHISEQVDLNKIITSKASKRLSKKLKPPLQKGITVAVAKDRAFGFYYPDDLDKFAALGVEIKYFDTFKASRLPKCDGLFIGGGFPEMHLPALSANRTLLKDIKTQIQNGLATYAECAGLMYLTNSIDKYPMARVIDATTYTTRKPVGRGYVKLEPTSKHPWHGMPKLIYAHEFHYSKLSNIHPNTHYGFKVLRGVGVDNKFDGIIQHNLLASYTHLRNVVGNAWVVQFVDFIKRSKNKS